MGDGKGNPKQKSAKRGTTPTTIVAPPPATASFVDPQPQDDRYNLAFFAAYADKDAVLAATDEAFLRLYHDEFPSALASKTVWATKSPGSRSHCKADLIKQVATIAEIAVAIKEFIADHRDKPKKFGTILLAGHGTPEEFALPIATPVKRGGKRLPLPHLEIGLRNADSLSDDTPKEWTAGAALWKDLRRDLMTLQLDLDMLHKWMGTSWTDDKTLMRVWCCNLGKQPKPGARDALEVFGEMFFGKAKFMIEAPQNKSASTYAWYTLDPSSPAKVKTDLFVNGKKKGKLWHPDAIAEVESDSKLTVYKGADLADAQQEFVGLALRTPPGPSKEKHHWIPVYVVEDPKKNPVYPQDWAKFAGFWRRVTH